ncbi:MAG: 30S ribosomal protein S8, small subunit ribosomal protein S8 [Candidatus Peregrinibacteria bacterium GW2011_GWF2_33_10]|nr:MAG: 30S ribosomal protein S8, small subunit ribosomal protein S8 [Candidatus Peregrinibacteria bacterium GW2011_GWF2_33_10]OGJ46123.1 MAG: 30S ribosomal protein S8 [Candidatus Peregrinibacteria bacterium RIFOXYA12_FULL_33_12]OGJ46171.1 MAG: 30S ribosomal protein S8 [Candidatus Peregrinibacteria bacterium RIFOXYA2_FULL_33_21]OGJ51588.1 MAG: 30S ribosomal protein S8 [Candidatus Peregrinibacteria bacterium RIFOXYB2_FULL_33_20]
MLTDPIADFLTRIRNAQGAQHSQTEIPASRVKIQLAEVLKSRRYIKDYQVVDKKILVEFNQERMNLNLRKMSKPGQRIYVGYKNIPKVLNGLGMCILSTPEGIMSGFEARAKKLGGELLCKIY